MQPMPEADSALGTGDMKTFVFRHVREGRAAPAAIAASGLARRRPPSLLFEPRRAGTPFRRTRVKSRAPT